MARKARPVVIKSMSEQNRRRRKSHVPLQQFDDNWDKIFGKKEKGK